MNRAKWLFTAFVATAAIVVAGCGSDSPSSGGANATSTPAAKKPKVGVILPDTASSARWEGADRPLLTKAFADAGVDADIQNANGDKAKFATIADQMLNEGVNALLIVNLDFAECGRGDREGQAAGRAGDRL